MVNSTGHKRHDDNAFSISQPSKGTGSECGMGKTDLRTNALCGLKRTVCRLLCALGGQNCPIRAYRRPETVRFTPYEHCPQIRPLPAFRAVPFGGIPFLLFRQLKRALQRHDPVEHQRILPGVLCIHAEKPIPHELEAVIGLHILKCRLQFRLHYL